MRRRRLRRTVVGLFALVMLGATAGCGVAIQTSAQPISVPNIFRTPAARQPPRHGRPVDVYFLTRGHLVASTRYVQQGKSSAIDDLLQNTLNQLAFGPTTTELRSGIVTAMSEFPAPQLSLVGNVRGGVASVELDSSFGLLDGPELFQADGQIVYTLTQFPQVHAVNLLLGGVKEAWLANGQTLYNGSVARHDYRSIRPLAT
jgi:spore germination protein GerM